MKVKTLLSLSVLSISLSTLSFPTFANTPKAVDKIDINQYEGKWYEIAHLPMYFQRQCVSDTSAKYAIKADNTISVLNSCRTASGEMKSSEGVAYPQNQGKSELKVTAVPQISQDEPQLRFFLFSPFFIRHKE